jgi:hypothetical protein
MLTTEAASDYYELTLIESDFGLIGLREFYSRLSFLVHNSDADFYYPPFDCDVLIDRPEAEETADTNEEWTAESSVLQQATESRGTRRYRVAIPPQPLMILFMCSSVSGARKWEFHQADVDPHPSVPHGHDTASARKLDAYTGLTFIKTREAGKEPRGLIVALWNDAKFRTFARKAVQWYMATYPRYHWRVRNPLTFPRY